MSGGYFDYQQYHIEATADSIDQIIREHDFKPETLERLKEAAHTLRQAAEMAQRVDWLVSCDDSEDSFLERWKKEVRPYYDRK